jgi:dipeptidyl aminopeptidase/acylaminoacyl peptidase
MDTIAAADVHDVVQVADPRVAPDGETVAFVRKVPDDDESYEATVYLVSTGSAEPRRFTVAEGVDAEPRFSPSGDRLAFTSTRGADDDTQQLWVVPIDGGEARQVTDVVGGVSSIEWSPDGDRVVFTQQVTAEDREEDRDLEMPEEYEPETPDPRVVDRTVYRAFENYFDGRRSHVYVADLSSDDAIERLTDGDRDFQHPTWGDDDTLYYASPPADVEDPDDTVEYELLEHDLATGDVDAIHRTTGWGAGITATADGRVAHLYQEEDQASMQPTELHVYDRESGDVTKPSDGLDRSLGYEAAPQWGPDEERLYFTTPDEGRVPLWSAAWDGSDDPIRVVDHGHVDGAHVGDDLVAYTQSEWDHPGDVFVATRGVLESRSDSRASQNAQRSGYGAETNRLTRVNSDYLDDRAVCQPEELAVESDGHEIQAWVMTPPDFDPDETYPLAVEVHGGPHAMWSTAGSMWHEFQTLAARGYVVYWSNPRGSTGYGEAFAQAIERDWGDVTMQDVMAGVERVADRDYVDDTNVFLTGGSFGGYMTSWMVGHTDYFSGAVTQRGVHDLLGFYGSTDGAYKLVEGDFDTDPWDEPEFLWEHSPTAYCDQVDTPTLVLHSEDDTRTPINTAELFHRGLRKHGVDTRLVRYPDEGHELSRSGQPGHVVDRIERIARWFDGYSDHHDAERALDREDDDGLTAGEDDDTAAEDEAAEEESA